MIIVSIKFLLLPLDEHESFSVILVLIFTIVWGLYGLPWWLSGKESTCCTGDSGDTVSIPGLERFTGGGNGNPLYCSCQENPMDRGACKLQSIGLQRVGHC